MNDDITKRVKEIQASDVFKRATEIQASMVESAKSSFDDSELGALHAVIRLTVEFHDYLEHGGVKIARAYDSCLTWGLPRRSFKRTCGVPIRTLSISTIWGTRVNQSFRELTLSAA